MAVARSFSGVVISTSGFMDDVIFAHKPRLLDVVAQLKRSAHSRCNMEILPQKPEVVTVSQRHRIFN